MTHALRKLGSKSTSTVFKKLPEFWMTLSGTNLLSLKLSQILKKSRKRWGMIFGLERRFLGNSNVRHRLESQGRTSTSCSKTRLSLLARVS